MPAGVFVIGTVEMKNNVTLHISAQGKLLASADGKQYHAADVPLRGDSTLGDGRPASIRARRRRPSVSSATWCWNM